MIVNARFEPGSYAFLIDLYSRMDGCTDPQEDILMCLFTSTGLHTVLSQDRKTRKFSVLVLSKFANWLVHSKVTEHCERFGKMKGTPKEEDVVATHEIQYMSSEGHFFKQSWSKIPETDKDAIDIVNEDIAHHVILEDDSWRGEKKCCPGIVSGGLNPVRLKPFIDVMGNVDFITAMGSGVHAHPDGTQSGAKSLSRHVKLTLRDSH
ncbi:MAG: RuBisCO large subunit C-terminal-like domain-containing protein [Methanolobus sp.]